MKKYLIYISFFTTTGLSAEYVMIGPPSGEWGRTYGKTYQNSVKQKEIQKQVDLLGKHRTAEAQKMVDLADAARKARGENTDSVIKNNDQKKSEIKKEQLSLSEKEKELKRKLAQVEKEEQEARKKIELLQYRNAVRNGTSVGALRCGSSGRPRVHLVGVVGRATRPDHVYSDCRLKQVQYRCRGEGNWQFYTNNLWVLSNACIGIGDDVRVNVHCDAEQVEVRPTQFSCDIH